MDKIVAFQFSRLKKSIYFWLKYILPAFLILIAILIIFLFVKSLDSFFNNVDFIISYLRKSTLEIDFFHIIKLILISKIKTLLFEILGLCITALLSWISYMVVSILLEFLYNKILSEHSSYQLIRQQSLPIMYSKTHSWRLIFTIFIGATFAITMISNFGKIVHDNGSTNVKFLINLFYIFLVGVIPVLYCFVWYLYKRFLKPYIGDNKFRILFFSKPAVARRLQSFLGAFIGLWIISQLFLLYFSEVRKYDEQNIYKITSNLHYKNFWESVLKEGYDKNILQSILEIGESIDNGPQISVLQEFYLNTDLAKDFVRVIYNIIIITLAFEIVFPYLIMFTMMKIKRKEIINLIKTASIPILVTILFQLLNEGLYFGIKLNQVINFRTSAVYIISFALAILGRSDILQFDMIDTKDED